MKSFVFAHVILRWLIVTSTIVAFGVLLHCRYTRRPHSVRILYINWLYYSFHYLAIRGGFQYIPQLSFAGLWAPIMATFLSSIWWEPILLFVVWLMGNGVIATLQHNQLLPEVTVDLTKLGLQNTVGLCFFGGYYFGTFWFVTHAYQAEFKSRHTLQSEVQLFMRLSHEIRTPLTIISGMVEVMKTWTDGLTLEQQCVASDLSGATRRLNNVVNDLLTFSNGCDVFSTSTADHVEDLSEFNIREVLDNVIEQHLAHAERSQLNIYVDIPAEVPLEVRGHKDQLASVLDQLVSNAVKFTPAGSISIQESFRLTLFSTYRLPRFCSFFPGEIGENFCRDFGHLVRFIFTTLSHNF